MDTHDGNNTKKIIAAFVVLLAVVMATVGVSAYNKKQESADSASNGAQTSESTAPENGTTPQTSDAPANNATSANLKDGTYTAKSEYSVPSGYEDISVSLTIKDGIATASQITHSENDRESTHYQERFSEGYKTHVVGKKVGDIKVPYIAGASDTAEAFDEALKKIIAQAQV